MVGQIDDNDEFFNFLLVMKGKNKTRDDMQVGSIWNQVDTVAQSRDEKLTKKTKLLYSKVIMLLNLEGLENKVTNNSL